MIGIKIPYFIYAVTGTSVITILTSSATKNDMIKCLLTNVGYLTIINIAEYIKYKSKNSKHIIYCVEFVSTISLLSYLNITSKLLHDVVKTFDKSETMILDATKLTLNIVEKSCRYSFYCGIITSVISTIGCSIGNIFFTGIKHKLIALIDDASRYILGQQKTKHVLTQDEIEKLCTLGHGSNNINICTSENCPICLDTVSNICLCRRLPCNHVFHPHCIDNWLLESSDTCPICRKKVKNFI